MIFQKKKLTLCRKKIIMSETKIFNYSNIFLSCFSDNEEYCMHQVSEHLLIYLYSGMLEIEYKGTKTIVKKNECVFLRKDHLLKFYKKPFGEEQYKGITMALTRNKLREFYAQLSQNEVSVQEKSFSQSIIPIKKRPEVESLFASLTPYFNSEIEPSQEIVSMKMKEAIMALLQVDYRFYPTLFDFTAVWKIDLMAFMNDNYMYDLSMSEIAHYTGRSLASFKRDFKKLSEVSPQKWIIKKRLEKAYEKIKQGEKPSKVYTEVGFKTLPHLYQAFKKEYGFSLSEV